MMCGLDLKRQSSKVCELGQERGSRLERLLHAMFRQALACLAIRRKLSGRPSIVRRGRTLPWDWHSGVIPEKVVIDDTAYVESSFSFIEYRSQAAIGVQIGKGSSTYSGTLFDVGSQGRVRVGDYVLVNGARLICDAEIEIGD